MGGAICAALLFLMGCASTRPLPTPAADAPKAYRIAPGDTLDVIVWREDKISGQVQVRPDGMITVPLAGDLKAAGLTPEEVAKAVREALARFIDDPNVVVRVAAMNSRRFFVVGNVRAPGMYELRPDQTFLQALAVAGGFTEFAARTHVRIVRIGASPLEPDYGAIVKGDAQDMPLEPNDTIVVP
ncbi:MAG: polysaccharide biosynthesis/export family protein [Candidatus Binatia bacterium]